MPISLSAELCRRISSFEAAPKKLYVRFHTINDYRQHERELYNMIRLSDGADRVIIYDESTKKIKMLPQNMRVNADEQLIEALRSVYGTENVEVV